MLNIVETTLGQRLKKARLERGISQMELCEGICSPSTISQLEGDKFIPSIEIVKKIAERLSLPLHELLASQEQQMELRVQIEIVRTYVESKNYQAALALADALIARDDLMEHQKRELLFNKAECLIWLNDVKAAIELLLQLQKKMEMDREPEDRNLAKIYDKLGTAYFYAQDMANSYANYLRAHRIVIRFPEFDELSAKITYNLGNVCRAMDYNEEAINYLNKAYEFVEKIDNPEIMASTFFALGISYSNIGQLELAENFLRKSQILYESINSMHHAQLVKQKYAFDILSQQQFDVAIQELNRCKDEFLRLGDISSACYVAARSAMLHIENGNLQEAEKYLTEGLSLLQKHKVPNNQLKSGIVRVNEEGQYAYFYHICAKFALLKNNYKDSQFYATKSSEIYAKIGSIKDAAEVLSVSAESHYQSGDLQKAYQITKEVNNLLLKDLGRRKF